MMSMGDGLDDDCNSATDNDVDDDDDSATGDDLNGMSAATRCDKRMGKRIMCDKKLGVLN